MERNGMLEAAYGAYGHPAGYYPGLAEPFVGKRAGYDLWLAKNAEGIEEIQRRIVDIAEGARAPGCIGEDKYTCVASLAQKFSVADNFDLRDTNIFAEIRYDVNGKPVTGSEIHFDGYPPNAKGDFLRNANRDATRDTTTFILRLNSNGRVATMEVHLPKDPSFAKTQTEYDATELPPVVLAITARACPRLTAAEVAKWFENSIKPRARRGPKERSEDGVIAIDTASPKTAFCGRKFAFHSVYGTQRNGYRREGFGGMTVKIE